jgi:hypothetical protein
VAQDHLVGLLLSPMRLLLVRVLLIVLVPMEHLINYIVVTRPAVIRIFTQAAMVGLLPSVIKGT